MSFFKGRAILWLLIPAVFAVAFLWDSEQVTKPQFVQEDSNPDYYLINTKSVEFSSEGALNKTFSSEKTLYYKAQMQTQLTNPIFSMHQINTADKSEDENLGSALETWKVSAKAAINNEQSEQLTLEGDVSLQLNRDGTSNPIYMSMPKLTIDMASQSAFTDTSVLLNHELYIMSADGMNADFSKQQIDFLANVKFKEL